MSCFAERGNKTAFTVWTSSPAVTCSWLLFQSMKHALHIWNVLSYSCTTEQATRRLLMKTESNVSHRKAERIMQSYQQERPCYNMPKEPLIKLVTVGAKHSQQVQIYLHQVIGAGLSSWENGSLSGPHHQT